MMPHGEYGHWGTIDTIAMRDVEVGTLSGFRGVVERMAESLSPYDGGGISSVFVAWNGYQDFGQVAIHTSSWKAVGPLGGWASQIDITKQIMGRIVGPNVVPDAFAILCENEGPDFSYEMSVVLTPEAILLGAHKRRTFTWAWHYPTVVNDDLSRLQAHAFPA